MWKACNRAKSELVIVHVSEAYKRTGTTRDMYRCSLVSGEGELWSTVAIINAPNFHPKFTLAAYTIGYRRPGASYVDRPSRTLLRVTPARQDGVLLRCMTTTALHKFASKQDKSNVFNAKNEGWN